jgi:hypothetical protein
MVLMMLVPCRVLLQSLSGGSMQQVVGLHFNFGVSTSGANFQQSGAEQFMGFQWL